MKDNIWRNDEEYMSYVGSLLETKAKTNKQKKSKTKTKSNR